MDREVALVLRGYVNLNSAQQSELVDYVNRYNRGSRIERDGIVNESISKSAHRMDVGPVGSGCPCCGR